MLQRKSTGPERIAAVRRGNDFRRRQLESRNTITWREHMNGIIYLIGLIVVVLAVLSFFGLG